MRLWSLADVRLGEQTMLGIQRQPSGLQLAELESHADGNWIVAASADGRLLAKGGRDGMVRLREAPGGRLVATLHGHTGTVFSVSLSADGGLLASGGMDGTVRLWSLADIRLGEQTMLAMQRQPSGQQLATLEGHTNAVRGVALSADGLLLASGSFDGTVRLWEV